MSSDVPDQIRLYLRARVTLIAVVTAEEERAITILRNVSKSRGDLITWDFADGFSVEDMTEADPATALDKIRDRAIKDPNRRDLYVLKDFHSSGPKIPGSAASCGTWRSGSFAPGRR